MRGRVGLCVAWAFGCALAALAASAAAANGTEPSGAAIAAAGRQARLREIDAGQDYCDGAMRIGDWLKALAGPEARAIRWSGGACTLGDDLNPSDAKSWPYCAFATITLRRPMTKADAPLIEIYLEAPSHGRPGPAYAFRSVMLTPEGGDLARSRKDFEADWKQRFPPPAGAGGCEER